MSASPVQPTSKAGYIVCLDKLYPDGTTVRTGPDESESSADIDYSGGCPRAVPGGSFYGEDVAFAASWYERLAGAHYPTSWYGDLSSQAGFVPPKSVVPPGMYPGVTGRVGLRPAPPFDPYVAVQASDAEFGPSDAADCLFDWYRAAVGVDRVPAGDARDTPFRGARDESSESGYSVPPAPAGVYSFRFPGVPDGSSRGLSARRLRFLDYMASGRAPSVRRPSSFVAMTLVADSRYDESGSWEPDPSESSESWSWPPEPELEESSASFGDPRRLAASAVAGLVRKIAAPTLRVWGGPPGGLVHSYGFTWTRLVRLGTSDSLHSASEAALAAVTAAYDAAMSAPDAGTLAWCEGEQDRWWNDHLSDLVPEYGDMALVKDVVSVVPSESDSDPSVSWILDYSSYAGASPSDKLGVIASGPYANLVYDRENPPYYARSRQSSAVPMPPCPDSVPRVALAALGGPVPAGAPDSVEAQVVLRVLVSVTQTGSGAGWRGSWQRTWEGYATKSAWTVSARMDESESGAEVTAKWQLSPQDADSLAKEVLAKCAGLDLGRLVTPESPPVFGPTGRTVEYECEEGQPASYAEAGWTNAPYDGFSNATVIVTAAPFACILESGYCVPS